MMFRFIRDSGYQDRDTIWECSGCGTQWEMLRSSAPPTRCVRCDEKARPDGLDATERTTMNKKTAAKTTRKPAVEDAVERIAVAMERMADAAQRQAEDREKYSAMVKSMVDSIMPIMDMASGQIASQMVKTTKRQTQ